MLNPYIVTIRAGHLDEAVPRFDRCFGPFRSESVAVENRDRLRARIARHLDRKVAAYNEAPDYGDGVYVRVDVAQLDNRAARYHYLDLEQALEEEGVIA